MAYHSGVIPASFRRHSGVIPASFRRHSPIKDPVGPHHSSFEDPSSTHQRRSEALVCWRGGGGTPLRDAVGFAVDGGQAEGAQGLLVEGGAVAFVAGEAIAGI